MTARSLARRIDLAAGFDRKIVVEQAVGGRGNRTRWARRASSKLRCWATMSRMASVVGEIVPGKEFYDYEAKYLCEGSRP